ncbi:TetR/AcrR family transcriptional regulator [Nakamurella leprariae]|uniref:TetR/AcrR family transcriptional regulator n=1 Tax=Nakamurella leprariae TaxID=2803911 RepID=A0A938YGV0_9ACTN|nr:TetR/AcrR family transcriptional regulator [Nakamurella leprariae]MBM9469266.1 TetR/AcrR family transcriptional regulator [Nakamurella leprariae]
MPEQRRTQAERRARTEHRVLEATLRLIAHHGSGAVTLAKVGVEAGYSRGIVTHQFGSRDELLTRAAQYAQTAIASPQTDVRGLPRLLLTVESYLAAVGRQEITTRAFLQMWAEAVTSQPSLRSLFLERDEHFRRLLAALITDGIGHGSIRSDVDADDTADLLVTQLRGTGLALMLTSDTAAYDARGAALLDFLQRGLAV